MQAASHQPAPATQLPAIPEQPANFQETITEAVQQAEAAVLQQADSAPIQAHDQGMREQPPAGTSTRRVSPPPDASSGSFSARDHQLGRHLCVCTLLHAKLTIYTARADSTMHIARA